MLLVKAKLAPSKISGIGLFADQKIFAGDIIWEFTEGLDLELSAEKIGTLSGPGLARILNYTYHCATSQTFVLCADDARFMNHANSPNTNTADEDTRHPRTVAARDIDIGEELTTNYSDYDQDIAQKLPEEFR